MNEIETQHIYSGISVSGGVALGPLWFIKKSEEVHRRAGNLHEEKMAFTKALENAAKEIRSIIAKADSLAGEIMEFQLALLEDEDLINPIFEQITAGIPAHEAWSRSLDQEISEYQNLDDPYFAERASDLVDLKQRVLHQLQDTDQQISGPQGAILVADELTPSEFLAIDWQWYAGAALRGGSPTSHVSILARAWGINLIVGLQAEFTVLEEGMTAILDAEQGILICQPDPTTLGQAHHRIELINRENQAAHTILNKPALTADGVPIKVLINLDEPSLLSSLSPEMCDGIGVTRTEFLFRNRQPPTEEEQLKIYQGILRWAAGRPVTIRTLDAGGDKPIPGITFEGESNPFLGMRGIRLSLVHEDLFLQQLRALCRAAVSGPLRIMIPMVTRPNEMQQVSQLIIKAKDELTARGKEFQTPEVGMMVEVPCAALMAEQFDVDFYSIGSNDLIQYTTATARDNPAVADLADPQNPAVLELIQKTIQAANRRHVDVSLCGDMASSPELIPTLLECGLRSFSCAPAQVGRVKLAINRWNSDKERK